MEVEGNSFDDLEKKLLDKKQVPKKIKIIIVILIILIILLIGASIFIYFYFHNKNEGNKVKEEDKKSEEEYLLEINGFKEEWYDIFGNRTINISYVENNVIPNSFHKNGANYIEELGDINNGKDWIKHDVNVYDLYIPFSSLSRKNKHNGIILFVHGGGFENNTKQETECFAIRFAKLGYITANIEYTNSLDKYQEKGYYRILDEITPCIKSIKKELISQNFDGDKLELSLYGISAGGQLIMLYSFSVKNKIIPLKYVMNSVGVFSIEPQNWYIPAIDNITLDNIELVENIENAKKNGSLIPGDNSILLHITNLMVGKQLSLEEENKLVINNKINTNDEKYKKIYKYAKYGSPINVIGNCTIPMLCLYGGNDNLVGVTHYSNLKKAYKENGAENNIELVYMKYAGHERFHHGTEHDIIAMKTMHFKMVEYAKKYFTND